MESRPTQWEEWLFAFLYSEAGKQRILGTAFL
jgi:hypothetical protein